jgi:hypothetical protein
MKSRTVALALAAGLLAVGCARNETVPVAEKPASVPAPAAEKPAPAPVVEAKPPAGTVEADRIAALVEQLGSQDYAQREAASKELAGIGKPALPALEKAAKDSDAERASRARDLVLRLGASEEEAKAPEIPGLAEAVRGMAGPSTVIGGNGVGVQVGVRAVAVAGGGGGAGNVRTSIEVSDSESRRTIETNNGSAVVAEGKSGFSLALTPKGGQARTFSAGSREEFRKKFPNLYAKYFGN